MDNDNKINQAPAIITRFLGDNISDIEHGKTNRYDLEEEFAATKKNNSVKIPLILITLIAATVGIAYLLTGQIKESSREVTIAIQSIDDLNLKNVLDVVEKTKEAHAQAVRKLTEITANKQNELALAESAYKQDVASINAMQGRKQKKAALLKKADQDYEAEKLRIETFYAESLAAAEKEVALQESNLTAFDAQRVKEAEAQQEIINNQKRLFDLEKRTLTKEYEARIAELEKQIIDQRAVYEKTNEDNIRAVQKSYQERIDAIDPLFKDRKAAEITAAAAAADNNTYVPFSSIPHNIPAYNPVKSESYESLASYYKTMLYLIEKMGTVPFENDLLSYIKSVDTLTRQAGAAAEVSLEQSATVLKNQNQTIAAQKQILDDRSDFIAALLRVANRNALESAFISLDAYMKQKNIAAIILDASDPQRISIRVNAENAVQDGITGYVFRNETQHIDNVTFVKDKDRFFVQWTPPQSNEPAGDTENEKPAAAPFKTMDVIFLSKS